MCALIASVNGVVSDPADARIPVTDEGLLRGDGVFEVMRIYGGRPFAMDEHLQRMSRSAGNLRLEIDLGAVQADIEAVLAQAGPVDAAIRALVTRGGNRVVLLEELKELPETLALALVTYAPTRILDGVKSLSYASNMLAGRLAREQGCDEALLVTPHGRVLEAPTSSFFCSLDGRTLVTPPLADHILDSITRRLVISVTGATERVTSSDDLREMSEAFFASTLREVHPIHAIDGRELPSVGGSLTRDADERVRAQIAQELGAAAR